MENFFAVSSTSHSKKEHCDEFSCVEVRKDFTTLEYGNIFFPIHYFILSQTFQEAGSMFLDFQRTFMRYESLRQRNFNAFIISVTMINKWIWQLQINI